tara:strand:+ start:166 stop:369 length:204 start_codon:yes stop_codon:yes gene_type:complete
MQVGLKAPGWRLEPLLFYSEVIISFLKMGATGFDGIRGRLNGMPSFRKLVNKAEHHISADYGQFAYA